MLAGIEDPEAKAVSTAERALAERARWLLPHADRRLCAVAGGWQLHLTGLVARADGSFLLKRTATGAVADAEAHGAGAGALAEGG